MSINKMNDTSKNSCISKNIKLPDRDIQICVNGRIVGCESLVHLVAKFYVAWIMKNKNYTPYFECNIYINDRRIVVDVCGYKRSINKPFIVSEIYTRAPVHSVVGRIEELRILNIPIIVVAPKNYKDSIFNFVKREDEIIFISLEEISKSLLKDLAIFVFASSSEYNLI